MFGEQQILFELVVSEALGRGRIQTLMFREPGGEEGAVAAGKGVDDGIFEGTGRKSATTAQCRRDDRIGREDGTVVAQHLRRHPRVQIRHHTVGGRETGRFGGGGFLFVSERTSG